MLRQRQRIEEKKAFSFSFRPNFVFVLIADASQYRIVECGAVDPCPITIAALMHHQSDFSNAYAEAGCHVCRLLTMALRLSDFAIEIPSVLPLEHFHTP